MVDTTAALTAALRTVSTPGVKITEVRPSLEDIFIQLVDGESENLRDELKSGTRGAER